MEGTIGEIKLWGGKFQNGKIPVGWAECNGQTFDTGKKQALFAVIGENYNKETN